MSFAKPKPKARADAAAQIVPQQIETLHVPIPTEACCKAWINVGRLDSGAWVASFDAIEERRGEHTIADFDAYPASETRGEAFRLAAAELADLACEDVWPPEARGAIQRFHDGAPWIAAPKRNATLSTTTPAGLAANDADAQASREAHGTALPAWRHKLTVDAEFAAAQRPLSADERERLKASIRKHGCRDPVVVWQTYDGGINGGREPVNLVVDGHNRHAICDELNLPFAVVRVKLADRAAALEWIRSNQLGRRNLSAAERDELLAREYRAEVAARKGSTKGSGFRVQGSEKVGATPPVATRKKAAEVVAEKHGVSPATVKRADKSARAKDRIARVTGRPLPAIATLTPAEIETLDALADKELTAALGNGVADWRLRREREAKRPKPAKAKQENELRQEAKRHVLRYLDTLHAIDAWRQSDFLLDAINEWRAEHNPTRSKSRRKPR